MKQLSAGIVAGLVVFALVVILGAAQETRTASKEVVIGSFNCNASVSGQFTTSIKWKGTAGIVGVPEGLSIDLLTVTEADPNTSCQALAVEIAVLASARGCQLNEAPTIGLSRQFGMVCLGVRDEVITTVGELSSRLAEALP